MGIQPIIINEFQPDIMWYGTKLAQSIIKDFAGASGLAKKIGDLKSSITNLAGNTLNAGGEAALIYAQNIMLDKYSKNPSELYNLSNMDGYVVDKPIQMIKDMFKQGRWLNTYELPFISPNYLVSNVAHNWTTGGLEMKLDTETADFLKNKMNMDVPTNPMFKIPDIGKTGFSDITFEFTLLNLNEEWLSKNFEFLHAFFAGTQWLQFPGGTIKSTNVYNIYCPGRFHIFWAALNMSVTVDGKLRECAYMSHKYNKIKSIDKNTLWPEAWKISVTIKDLTPNNFNTYIHHFVHGFETGTVNILYTNEKDGESTLSNLDEATQKKLQEIAVFAPSTNGKIKVTANSSLNLGLTALEKSARFADARRRLDQEEISAASVSGLSTAAVDRGKSAYK